MKEASVQDHTAYSYGVKTEVQERFHLSLGHDTTQQKIANYDILNRHKMHWLKKKALPDWF